MALLHWNSVVLRVGRQKKKKKSGKALHVCPVALGCPEIIILGSLSFGTRAVYSNYTRQRASPRGAMIKKPPANAGDIRYLGSIHGLGRSPRGTNNKPLQYSCLENPMDRGAWQALIHRVTKSWTLPKQLSMHLLDITSQSKSNQPNHLERQHKSASGSESHPQ